jgi:hypothetical protein
MKSNVNFYRKIIAMFGIALLVAGIARTSRANDVRFFADKSKFTTIDFPGATGTAAFGINPQREIVGNHYHVSCCPFTLEGV